jgi:7-carboxy-7-deazaguanine synthase
MNINNLKLVDNKDVYKFVVGSMEDLQMAYELINKYDLTSKCLVYLSPVSGDINMQEIVEFMKNKNLNKVRLQVQLHKIIWDKNARGV